jgi:hypothetical protein
LHILSVSHNADTQWHSAHLLHLAHLAAGTNAAPTSTPMRPPSSPIWLGTPQDWARNQIDSASLRAHNANGSAPARDELEFGCPKCRFSYPAAQAPRSYTCFCGKQQDPDFDP